MAIFKVEEEGDFFAPKATIADWWAAKADPRATKADRYAVLKRNKIYDWKIAEESFEKVWEYKNIIIAGKAAWREKKQMEKQQKKIGEQQKQLDEQQKEIQEQQKKFEEQQKQLEEQQKQIDEQKKQIYEQKKQLEEQQKKIDQQQKQLEEQQTQIAEQQKQIESRREPEKQQKQLEKQSRLLKLMAKATGIEVDIDLLFVLWSFISGCTQMCWIKVEMWNMYEWIH